MAAIGGRDEADDEAAARPDEWVMSTDGEYATIKAAIA